MNNPKIETDLSEMLLQINSKLDKMSVDITELKIGQIKVETKLEAAINNLTEIKSAQKTLVSDVADLKGAKSLVIPIVVAVTVSILTLVIRSIPIV